MVEIRECPNLEKIASTYHKSFLSIVYD